MQSTPVQFAQYKLGDQSIAFLSSTPRHFFLLRIPSLSHLLPLILNEIGGKRPQTQGGTGALPFVLD